jgi:AraC family transcriptional regulator
LEVVYQPSVRYGLHQHVTSNITLILDGSFEETCGGVSRIGGPGSVLVKAAGIDHSNRIGPRGARTLVLEFGDEADHQLGSDWIIRRCGEERRAWRHCRRAMQSLLGLYPVLSAGGDDAGVENSVVDLLAALDDSDDDRPTPPAPPWLAAIQEALHERYAERIRVSALSRELRLHPVYLARVFRRSTGHTVTGYLRNVRVARAAHRISATDEPLSTIAAETGFADQAHLNRSFKAIIGTSPGAYRRAARTA